MTASSRLSPSQAAVVQRQAGNQALASVVQREPGPGHDGEYGKLETSQLTAGMSAKSNVMDAGTLTVGSVMYARTVRVSGSAAIGGSVRAETITVGGTLHQGGPTRKLRNAIGVPAAVDTDGVDQVTDQFTADAPISADRIVVRGQADVGSFVSAHKRVTVGNALTVGAVLEAKNLVVDGDATVGNAVIAKSVTANRVVRS